MDRCQQQVLMIAAKAPTLESHYHLELLLVILSPYRSPPSFLTTRYVGVAAAVVSHPADTLLSMINEQGDEKGGTTSRLIKLARETGFRKLCTVGLLPRYFSFSFSFSFYYNLIYLCIIIYFLYYLFSIIYSLLTME